MGPCNPVYSLRQGTGQPADKRAVPPHLHTVTTRTCNEFAKREAGAVVAGRDADKQRRRAVVLLVHSAQPLACIAASMLSVSALVKPFWTIGKLADSFAQAPTSNSA